MKKVRFLAALNRSTLRVTFGLVMITGVILMMIFLLLIQYRSNLISLRERELKRMVTIALGAVQPTIDEFEAGALGYDEALEDVRNTIRRMTYEGEAMENYIFMSGYDYKMLVQSLEPWMEDQYQGDLQDIHGTYYIRELVKTARSESGEGYVTYYYPHPGSERPEKKISYVRGIDSLDCYIGTGMYLTDINVLFQKYLLSPMLFIWVAFLFTLFLFLFILRPLTSCFRILVGLFKEITLTPETHPAVPLSQFPPHSEEFEILSGFEEMLVKIENHKGVLREKAEILQREVEERKEIQRALGESESRWRYLYEESTGARIMVDRRGIVRDINLSLLGQLGYRKEEVVGRPVESLVIPQGERGFLGVVEDAFRDGIDHAQDFDFISRSGERFSLLFSHSLFLPDEEGVDQVLITGLDITNRKRAEKEAEKQRKRLMEADKLRSLGILVAGVAHEINNPNQFIRSNAPLLSEAWDRLVPVLEECGEGLEDVYLGGVPFSQAKVRIADYLEGIRTGSERIGKIVEDLKSFARQDGEKMSSGVEVNRLVESSLNLCRNLVKNSTNHLGLSLASDLPSVRGNPQKLEQVFINLIQNACQALPDREKALQITTYHDGEAGEVCFLLEDQGEGVPSALLGQITDPFFTTKREQGGSGLGLSVSLGIVKEHKGRMEFRSEEGKGTTVLVSLPEERGGEHE